MIKILITLALLIFTIDAHAATYYLREDGTAAAAMAEGPCTSAGATMRMADHNAGTFLPGDTIIVCDTGGDFDSTNFVPPSSGSGQTRIYYVAETGHTPVFSGRTNGVVLGSGRHSLKFVGLTFQDTASRWVEIGSSTWENNYIWFDDCTFYDANTYQGLRVENSQYWKITNCTFPDAPILSGWTSDRWGADCQSAFEARTTLPSYCDYLTAPSDTIRIATNAKKGLIEGNTFGSVDHNSIHIYNGEDVVVRDNIAGNGLHSTFNVNSQYASGYTARTLFQGNTITDTGAEFLFNPIKTARSTVGAWNTNDIQMTGLIIARNNVFDSGATAITLSGYNETAERTSKNSRIYHNTVYNALYDQALYMNNSVEVTNVKTVNNIFFNASNQVSHGYTTRSISNRTDYGTPINYWIGNLYTPGVDNFYFKNTSTSNKTLATLLTMYPTEWLTSNASGNPLFADASTSDFTLSPVSPAINAAEWLTTISTATGSGTSFTVVDPLFFYDGWGIPGEVGDMVYTSAGQSARITSINYTTGAIVVGSSITWTQDDGITTVNYTGAAPDIGAFEYGSVPPVVDPTPSRAASFRQIYLASGGKILPSLSGGRLIFSSARVTVEDSDDADIHAMWRFESQDGTDSSGNGNTLTAVGTPIYNSTNPLEGFYSPELNGSSQYFTIADASLAATFPLSSTWAGTGVTILAKHIPYAITDHKYLVSKYNSNTDRRSFGLQLLAGGVYHFIIGHTSGTVLENISPLHASVVTAGQKYGVAFTLDTETRGYRLRVWDYTAGAVLGTDATGNFTNAISLTTAALMVGGSESGRYLYGLIDDVWIVDRVMSTTDIDKYFAGTYGN